MREITLNDIRNRATPESFRRGENYYRRGAIFDTVRRGNTLEGECQGSEYMPYHLQVTLDRAGNIEATSCTCQYDWGGDCKHIVALLLTYLEAPEVFEERAPVKDGLAGRSREQLIALIREMIARYPDLQTLIDRPIPDQQPEGRVIDMEPLRRELRQAVGTFGEWGDHRAEHTVYSIANLARQFEATGDWRSASAIYRAIIEESVVENHYPADDEGEFGAAVSNVLGRLVGCLDHEEVAGDDAERRAVLDRLLDAYIWDINMGGFGLSDNVTPEALLARVKPDDFPLIRERILAAQRRKARSEYGRWAAEAYESFLMHLDTLQHVDPEDSLQRLRDQGLHRLLAGRLLSMDRVGEAVAVITDHLTTPYERLQVLPLLVSAGHDDIAIRLARQTLDTEFDDRLAAWLAAQYTEREDRDALFELRMQCMREHPGEAYYAALKAAADAIGSWDTVRPMVIRQLEQNQLYHVLVRVYLHDQEWDAAWDTLARIPHRSQEGRSGWTFLDFEVAERSRHARPHRAIPVYIAFARREIDLRSRANYAQAAAYLSIVQELYSGIDEPESWDKLIEGLREEFRRLPAFQDELKKAGL